MNKFLRNTMSINIGLALLLVLAIFLTSCSSKDDSKTSNSKAKIEGLENCPEYVVPNSESLEGDRDPIASSKALPCGTLSLWGSSMPKSLNMWLDYNSFSASIMSLMFESLVGLHSTENKYVGGLAKSWSISEDGKEFTFNLNPKAKWSDGSAITAEDVQYYYDVIMNKKNMTAIFRVGLKRLERPEIIDSLTLKIKAKEAHWANFQEAAGLSAFPKKAWKNKDFNKIKFEFDMVSGPYKIKELKKDRYLMMERRTDWWGWTQAYNQNKYNFLNIKYRFMNDRNKALEALKKEYFDMYAIYTSSIWMKKTDFDFVEKNWVVKQEVFNKEPIGFQGMAINMRQDKYKNLTPEKALKVRKALTMLLNRELMNEKFMYNQYFLQNSYYPDLYPNNVNPDFPVIGFNPDSARVLMEEAGWKVNAKGILEKDGKPFEVSFITALDDKRHLTRYQEDLKSIGIKANIEQLSYATIRKRLDDFDFDMYWINWGASRMRDPEGMWSSKTANQPGSNNLTGFEDDMVDSLIEFQKTEMNLSKRNDILRQIDKRINELSPYVLMWQSDRTRLLYWNKFGTPKNILDKYNREDAAVVYWWYDQAKAKKLLEAKANDTALPKSDYKIVYED